jgi:hypothetical protein
MNILLLLFFLKKKKEKRKEIDLVVVVIAIEYGQRVKDQRRGKGPGQGLHHNGTNMGGSTSTVGLYPFILVQSIYNKGVK